jgi:hypothetical protein
LLLTAEQVAKRRGRSTSWVYNMIKRGAPCIKKDGRGYRFNLNEFTKFTDEWSRDNWRKGRGRDSNYRSFWGWLTRRSRVEESEDSMALVNILNEKVDELEERIEHMETGLGVVRVRRNKDGDVSTVPASHSV